MKISDLRPCDACGGPISPQFYVMRSSIAVFKPHSANAVVGLTLQLGSLGLAEVFSPDPDVVTVAMDMPGHNPLMVELLLCQHCYLTEPLNLAVLTEKRAAEIQKQEEAE